VLTPSQSSYTFPIPPGYALTADGCQPVAVIDDPACCPPPLCGNDLCCTFVAFFNLLPSGPLWDFWKAKAISYFQHNPNPDPMQCPLINDPDCPSLVLHAIYCVLKLKAVVHDALWPALRESNPATAVTTLDYWVTQLQWEDCYAQHCRSLLLGTLTPYEINSDCGPLFCPADIDPKLLDAVKHGVLKALSRLQMGVIKNLCGLNWVIAPLNTEIVVKQPQSPNPPLPPEPDLNQCQGYCAEPISFVVQPISDKLDAVGNGELCETQMPPEQIPAYYDWGCMTDLPMGLPYQIWPGVLAAECIVRSLMPVTCPTNIIRHDCDKFNLTALIQERANAMAAVDAFVVSFNYAVVEKAAATDTVDASMATGSIREQAHAADSVSIASGSSYVVLIEEKAKARDTVSYGGGGIYTVSIVENANAQASVTLPVVREDDA
jgi:hypothetical protein